MKARLAFVAAALIVCAAPAHSGTILPHLYAMRFCSLRSIGASLDDARGAAIREATISENTWIWVNYGGQQMRSDAVEAAQAVASQCPQFLGK